jgi:toxin ParE1/3/4
MSRYSIYISNQAEHDLREMYEYIAFELLSPENAAAQLSRLEAAVESLETFPEKHRLYNKEPWKSRNLRVLPVDNYCIFYIPDKKSAAVTVIRVIYGGRNIEEQLDTFTELIE